MEFDESLRQRAPKKLLRVTMPDGQVLCYSSNRTTFLEVLRRIDIEELQKVNLEVGHYPLISQEIPPLFKDYMKPLVRGWYVNLRSSPEEKFLQLISIKNQLGLDYRVEISEDFEPDKTKGFQKAKISVGSLLVKFPDGDYVGGESPIQTYTETVRKLGVDNLKRRSIVLNGKNLITSRKEHNGQVQLDDNNWLTVPPSTKDKLKYLRIFGSHLRVNLEVTII